jgi:hypothetical protein
MKFVEPRTYAHPDVAARKLIKIEPVQNGRIYIELSPQGMVTITR